MFIVVVVAAVATYSIVAVAAVGATFVYHVPYQWASMVSMHWAFICLCLSLLLCISCHIIIVCAFVLVILNIRTYFSVAQFGVVWLLLLLSTKHSTNNKELIENLQDTMKRSTKKQQQSHPLLFISSIAVSPSFSLSLPMRIDYNIVVNRQDHLNREINEQTHACK